MQTILKLALWVLFALPLAAQNPVIFGSKKGLVRSGATALYKAQSVNLLKYSQDFGNSVWQKQTSSSVLSTDSVIAPDGSSTADKISLAAFSASAIAQNAVVFSGPYTFSFWIKGATGTEKIRVQSWNSTNGAQYFSDVTLTTSWQRLAYTRTLSASTSYWYIQNVASPVAEEIHLWGGQLNEGSSALPYEATTDLQQIPNLVSGGASMQLGTTSGVDTSDPVRRLVGLSFDGVDDRVSNLPAKGSTWTTTNCTATECYTIDSAGGEWVNGAARVNRATWTEVSNGPDSGATYTANTTIAPDGTLTADTITNDASGPLWRVTKVGKLISSGPASYSIWIKGASAGSATLYFFDTTDATSASLPIAITTGWTRYTVTHTFASPLATFSAQIRAPANFVYYVWGWQIESAPTSSAYQKTEGATEMALETAGGFSGTLTFLGRWSQILGTARVRQDYFTSIKPPVNQAGGQLP